MKLKNALTFIAFVFTLNANAQLFDLAGSTLRVVDGKPDEIVLTGDAARVIEETLNNSEETIITQTRNCLPPPPTMPVFGDDNSSDDSEICTTVTTISSSNGAYSCSTSDRLSVTVCKVNL